MSSFFFMADEFPALEKLGVLTEGCLYTDPNSCLYKIGSLAESIVKQMLEFEGIQVDVRATHADKIQTLKYRGVLEKDIKDIYPEWNVNQTIATSRPTASIIGRFLYRALLRENTLAEVLGDVCGELGTNAPSEENLIEILREDINSQMGGN